MDKITITMPEQMRDYVKNRIQTGQYGNVSEYFRDLVRQEQASLRETPEEIRAIRAKLIEAEKSGFSEKSVDEIWNEARRLTKHAEI